MISLNIGHDATHPRVVAFFVVPNENDLQVKDLRR